MADATAQTETPAAPCVLRLNAQGNSLGYCWPTRAVFRISGWRYIPEV